MASRCLAGREALFSVVEALVTGRSIFSVAPTSGAFGERLAQNTPNRPLPQPLLIAQGLADDLVLPRFSRDSFASAATPVKSWNTAATPDAITFPSLRRTLRSRRSWCNGHRIASTEYRCRRAVTEETPNNRLQRTALSAAAEPERYAVKELLQNRGSHG